MKKILFIIFFLMCFPIILSISVNADNSNEYYNNTNWIETSKAEIDSKYNNREKFIVVFYRPECSKCKYIVAHVISHWMDDYSYTIYGVNVDNEIINEWVLNAINNKSANLPLVAFVDNKKVIVFSGAERETVEEMNKTFQKFSTSQYNDKDEGKKTNFNNVCCCRKDNDKDIKLLFSNLTLCSKIIVKKTINCLLKIAKR